MGDVQLREVTEQDAGAIADIYNHYIRESTITFEETVVSVSEIESRIKKYTETHPWLVAETDGVLTGYAYATPWHSRSAYRYSSEVAIYLSKAFIGRGIGDQLLATLLQALRQRNQHCVFALIGLPNPESVGLMEKHGFTRIGILKEVGLKFERWIDVGIWQLVL